MWTSACHDKTKTFSTEDNTFSLVIESCMLVGEISVQESKLDDVLSTIEIYFAFFCN